MTPTGWFKALVLLAVLMVAAPVDAQCGDCVYLNTGTDFICYNNTSGPIRGNGKVGNSECWFGPPCGGGQCCKICAPVIELFGTAGGGSIDLWLGGNLSFSYVTVPGESPASVVANLADLVNAAPPETTVGISASASGSELTISGTTSIYVKILDPGLNRVALEVPAMSRSGILALIVLLAAGSLFAFRRQRAA